MKLRVISILCGLAFTFFTSSAFAAWAYAENFTYFDASGNVVGQSLLSCSTATPRKAAGVTSIYWREDVTLCMTTVKIVGELCYRASDGPGWLCVANQIATQPSGVRNTRIDHLPPGMTDAVSCSLAACGNPTPTFLPALQSSVHIAGSESYPPNENDCQAAGGDCLSWLIQ
jgi:hypothetical protein